MNIKDFSLKPLKDASKQLQKAYEIKPVNDIVRDGTIQRFEYTYELSWKTLKRFLELVHGIEENQIKSLYRESARIGLIKNLELWFQFHEARNKTSHIYSRKVARDVYKIAKKFPVQVKILIENLEKQIKKWRQDER